MTEDMVVDAAVHMLDGMLFRIDNSEWNPCGEDHTREVLTMWRRREGSEVFTQLVDLLAQGQEVTSPICSSFTYRAASLAGRQKQLF